MKIELDRLMDRAVSLMKQHDYEAAWSLIEPASSEVTSDPQFAILWISLAEQSDINQDVAAHATDIISTYTSEWPLVAKAAGLLIAAAEKRPFDEAPLDDGPARVAVDALRGVIASLPDSELKDRDTGVWLFSDLAMALRMTGSQDDDEALRMMQKAIALDPENGESWFKLGLLHKWRGRWNEGVEAYQRARALGSDSEGTKWNLAICATGAGDYDLAIEVSRELGIKIDRGADGLPFGSFAPVQVRVSTLGEGINPAAHIPGVERNFENMWVERHSLCHGKIVNASIYELPVDYGDIVLWDGAPVGYRVDGEERVPRFPLLQRLQTGAYRRYWFLATQPHGGALEKVNEQLPGETQFYVHEEQVNMLCGECARGETVAHDHARTEASTISGKFVVPDNLVSRDFGKRLEKLIPSGVVVAMPRFYEEAGDKRRAKIHAESWDEIEARGERDRNVVHCDAHGLSEQTFVCQHLVTGEELGFFAANDGSSKRPDAWCGACEQVRIREGGGWNETSELFAGITLICGKCYDDAKARNARADGDERRPSPVLK